MSLGELVQAKSAHDEGAVEKEAAKGYSIVFVGLEQPIAEMAQRFESELQGLVENFAGPVAIALNGTRPAANPDAPLNILSIAVDAKNIKYATASATIYDCWYGLRNVTGFYSSTKLL